MPAAASKEAPNRRTMRRKIFHPATLHVRGDALRIHLLDISEGGLLAHATVPPPMGAMGRIMIDGRPHGVQVMWIDGRRFGCAFTIPLAAGDVALVIADPTALG